jgi:hypothetical protein
MNIRESDHIPPRRGKPATWTQSANLRRRFAAETLGEMALASTNFGLGTIDAAKQPMESPVPQVDDLSRSLTAFDQDSTLIAVIEMSLKNWLVAGSFLASVARR